MSFASILLVVTLVCSGILLVWNSWPTKTYIKPRLDSYYDYVIVGGGTAGCVLAARLSEDPNMKVALLEAGGEETDYPSGDIPHSAMDLVRTSADWGFQTQPQNHSCLGLKDQKSNWPRGRVLGGSSFISWMSYIRGNHLDYDRWAADGATGWSFEEVLPYFKLAENNKNKEHAKSSFHGNEGPLTVQDSMAAPKLTTAFKRAARELGYKVGDVNGKSQFFVNFNQMTAQYGKRMSTATAYLRPAIERKNLHVLTGALATKVLFKERRAIGVEYLKNDTEHQIYAKKEVILSSGTVGSAKLLLLSGVGPKEHLDELGIEVMADLPVGNNLVDQLMTDGMVYQLMDPVTITNQKAKGLLPLLDYLVFGSGLLASTGVEGVGFFKSNAQPEDDLVPYLQILLFPSLLSQDDNSRKQAVLNTFNHVPQYFNEIHGGLGGREGLLLIPVLLHPKSNGTVRLASTDPHQEPLIQPNYLTHQQDVNILLDGIRLSQTLMETKAMKRFIIKYHQRVHPGCSKISFDSDAYWQCYIRHNTLSAFNPVGTCRMGAEDDARTVVTPDLSVKGLRKLRVIDASVIPSSLSGGTLAATVMIAERAADLISGRDRTRPLMTAEEIKAEQHRKAHIEL